MKKILLLMLALIATVAIVGCDDDDSKTILITLDPEPPQGVTSVTGDNAVYIFFAGPYLANIREYIVKRSLQETTGYQEIGRVTALSNPNLDLIHYEYIDNSAVNGTTYFYAVSTIDNEGRESALSAELVFDTPRPEGSTILFDSFIEPSLSGFNLASGTVVAWDSPAADVWIDSDTNGVVKYINVGNVNTDIQDVGYHEFFDEVGWSPQDGWSVIDWQEVIEGHIYIIWTDDLHYAKMWVTSVNSTSVSFQWAYQTDAENPELAPPAGGNNKPIHGPEYLKVNPNSIAYK